MSASTVDEIERSNRIDDNIAKDIIGASGDSEEGYIIDFYDAVWTPVSEEEVETHAHTLVKIPDDYPEIPNPSGWTGETYIEVFNTQTSEHSFLKNVTTNNYISTANTIVDAIEDLDAALKTESDRAKETEETLQKAIDAETERAISAETVLQEELDTTQEGAGLNEDGTYSSNSESNYISGATSLNDADVKLDEELNRAEGEDIADTGHTVHMYTSEELGFDEGIILVRKNNKKIKINIDTNFGLLPNYD